MKRASGRRIGAMAAMLAAVMAATAWAQGRVSWEQLASRMTSLHSEGRYAESASVGEQALKLAELIHGPDDPLIANTLASLAMAYDGMAKYGRAEELLLRAVAIREKSGGADPDLGRALNNLGLVYAHQEKYVEAEEAYTRAEAIWDKRPGPRSEEIATVLNNRASLLEEQGDFEAAEPLYARSMEILQALRADDPRIAVALNNRAHVKMQRGDDEGARALYEQSLALLERTVGSVHPHVAAVCHNLARLDERMKRPKAAESPARRACAKR
jgi:tetratricopeptide (TPR) repeat protein